MNVVDIESLRGLDAFVAARDEAANRTQDLEAEFAGRIMPDEAKAEFESLTKDLIPTLDAGIEELQTRKAEVERIVKAPEPRRVETGAYSAPAVRRTPDNIYDLAAYRARAKDVDELPALYRDGAMRALEQMSFPTSLDANATRAHLERIIERHRDDDHGNVSRHIIGTSSPAYVEAYLAKTTRQELSPRMLAVMQSYSDTDGGVSLPAQIDPTFINTSDGSVNPLRQPGWARVETITGKSWSPVTTAGVVAAYAGERTTSGAADGAPTDLEGPTATPVRADVSIDLSLEYLGDYGSAALLSEVGGLVQSAKDDLEADKFFQGNGSGEPEGIIWKLDDEASSLVPTITDNVFVLADIDKLIGTLPARFRARGRMAANLAIQQLFPAFGTAGQPGNSIFDAVAKTLRGYPLAEATAMDDTAGDAKEILLFGDFRHFVIVDRLGMTSRALDSYDGSGRPTGNTTLYVAWRNTSKVLAVNAFRLLTVA